MRSSAFEPPLVVLLAAALIFGWAAWLRLSGVAWDGWANLHPDERHMIFVTQDLQRSLAAALEHGQSLWSIWFGPEQVLNPRAEGRMHVYGDLPLLVLVWLSHALGISDWGGTVWLGRTVTALVEACSVLAIFVLSQQLRLPARAGLAAAVLLAMSPSALQLANFFTADAWLTAFSTWALVALVALASAGEGSPAIAAGLLAGLAAAAKLTAIALLLPALAALAIVWRWHGEARALRGLLLGLMAAFWTFRLANPSAFAGNGFWDLRPSPEMLEDFRELAAIMANTTLPPNLQWQLGYSYTDLARDFALFGCGPVLAVLGLAGLWRPKGTTWIVIAALLADLLMNASSDLLILRYLAPVVPVMAMLALAPLARLPATAVALITAVALWWGWGTVRLHDGQHPRLITTEWMQNLPAGTKLGIETGWDESLPVQRTPPFRDWEAPPGPFTQINLDLTDLETEHTVSRLVAALDEIEVLVISSGRQIEMLPRLPQQFPSASRFYAALLAGDLCFTRVLYLDRGYPLPFWRIDDGFAQEAWRVYDHPVVQIWRKEPCFDRAMAVRLISDKSP